MAKLMKGPAGASPKGGMQPKQKPAEKPAAKMAKIAKGAPTKGNGSDTNPWSSARKR